MGWFARLLGEKSEETLPLYNAVVAAGRAPHWYVEGQVPDTVDGRFDMITAIVAVVMMRLEDDPAGAAANAQLAERFVDDMDGQMRELGIGDVVVGKHVGKMMSLLGGRLGAYRQGLADGTLDAALVRNLYRGNASEPAAVAHVSAGLAGLRRSLDEVPLASLIEGQLP